MKDIPKNIKAVLLCSQHKCGPELEHCASPLQVLTVGHHLFENYNASHEEDPNPSVISSFHAWKSP